MSEFQYIEFKKKKPFLQKLKHLIRVYININNKFVQLLEACKVSSPADKRKKRFQIVLKMKTQANQF